MRKNVLISIVLFTLLLMTSCGRGGQAASTSERTYPVSTVKVENILIYSDYPAILKGKEDIEIRPRIDGFIEDIYVDEGSVVQKGQLLFKINSPQAQQAYTSAVAGIESAKAQVATAQVNVDRIRPLVEKEIIAEVQLKTALNSLETAKAGLVQANANLDNAKATIGWTNVTSPVNGLIGEIPYRLGSLVNSANVLTTVANTSSVYAHFSLTGEELISFLDGLEGSTQAEKLANAPDVTLKTSNGTTYEDKGRIETIAGSLNPTTGTANFRAEFANAEGRLRSGASGIISIGKELDNVFVIPQKATFALQDKTILYLVDADNVVQQKAVEVIPMPDGKNYAVTSGLKDGDRILMDGIITVSHGVTINVQ